MSVLLLFSSGVAVALSGTVPSTTHAVGAGALTTSVAFVEAPAATLWSVASGGTFTAPLTLSGAGAAAQYVVPLGSVFAPLSLEGASARVLVRGPSASASGSTEGGGWGDAPWGTTPWGTGGADETAPTADLVLVVGVSGVGGITTWTAPTGVFFPGKLLPEAPVASTWVASTAGTLALQVRVLGETVPAGYWRVTEGTFTRRITLVPGTPPVGVWEVDLGSAEYLAVNTLQDWGSYVFVRPGVRRRSVSVDLDP